MSTSEACAKIQQYNNVEESYMSRIDDYRRHSNDHQSPNSSSSENYNGSLNNNNSNNDLSSTTENTMERHSCEVCGDESDGLHFGQYTCRACAAFFRRTVSLKLEYTCKHDGHCPIEKSARNMCRQCRYQKCLDKGMLVSAVQHARDGLGKRNIVKKNSLSNVDSPDIKIPKALIEQHQSLLLGVDGGCNNDEEYRHFHQQSLQQSMSTTTAGASSNGNGLYSSISLLPQNVTTSPTPPIQTYSNAPTTGTGNKVLLNAANQLASITNNRATTTVNSAQSTSFPVFHLNALGQATFPPTSGMNTSVTTFTSPGGTIVYENAADGGVRSNSYLLGQAIAGPNSAFTALQQQIIAGNVNNQIESLIGSPTNTSSTSPSNFTEMKYLSRMLEGYNHFMSLRKASYTLIEGFPKYRENDEIPQSNFGTSKKICKIEASLIMDTVEKFFIPFDTLKSSDKNLLFNSFYCLFSNTERAFRTFKTFGANDDRLLMPDGGYIRLSELEKFYENNSLVRGDPLQVAKIFENAMDYLINVVVAHMRSINITEIELMALFGFFIWRDMPEISSEGMHTILATRNNIIIDLHSFYRSQGYMEADVTVKTANVLLLLPKLENSVKLLKENFHIAELFNMMDLTSCCTNQNCT